MKRILSVELSLALAIVALIFSLATGCKVKPPPSPSPEPTPEATRTRIPTIVVVEPTVTPGDGSPATCYVPVPRGSPPFCRNASGVQATCPANMAGLPTCD
jgi:hypothetical protein